MFINHLIRFIMSHKENKHKQEISTKNKWPTINKNKTKMIKKNNIFLKKLIK
jgi:hypothetical protein